MSNFGSYANLKFQFVVFKSKSKFRDGWNFMQIQIFNLWVPKVYYLNL